MARSWLIALSVLLVAEPVRAQQPLSAIDWMRDLPQTVTVPAEPEIDLRPEITVEPLDPALPPVGLVSGKTTGLADTLWQGSEPDRIARMIKGVSVAALPATRRLLFTLLLTDARRTSLASDPVLEARARRLMAMGAVDPAFELLQGSQPLDDAGLVSTWFDAALLVGETFSPCRRILETPRLSPGYAASVFCAAREGRIAAATVMFDGARSLGLMSAEEESLLDRLLHPEFFEEAPPLAPPATPSPLIVTLRAAIGEPMSAANLPRPYAVLDLRDAVGWKAQLEAAERLGRSGALSANGLLGVYSARSPAASGGIWDRVAAVQRFEAALFSRNANNVAETLPDAWDAMLDARLTVAFADLFAADLELMTLPPPVDDQALRLLLLSDRYETAAARIESKSSQDDLTYLAAVARGNPGAAPAIDPQRAAISDGFAPMPALPPELRDRGLGETILMTLDLLDRGARGNLGDLTDALLGLRALGLEDVARRAVLQLLILGPDL